MNPLDALVMAMTPGTAFNQNNRVFRSAKALAQFAGVPQNEVLELVANNLADRVTIRPSAKRPENGPLIALTEFIPLQAEAAEAPQVVIAGGNAFQDDAPEPPVAEDIADLDPDTPMVKVVQTDEVVPAEALDEDDEPEQE